MPMPTREEMDGWSVPQFLSAIGVHETQHRALSFFNQFRLHQKALQSLRGIIVKPFDVGMDDTPVQYGHMVSRYRNCTSYEDTVAVDKEILGLGENDVLADLVELHGNYNRKGQPDWENAMVPLRMIAERPEDRVACKRAYFEEMFKDRLSITHSAGDGRTIWTIKCQFSELTDEQTRKLTDIIFELSSLAPVTELSRTIEGSSQEV